MSKNLNDEFLDLDWYTSDWQEPTKEVTESLASSRVAKLVESMNRRKTESFKSVSAVGLEKRLSEAQQEVAFDRVKGDYENEPLLGDQFYAELNRSTFDGTNRSLIGHDSIVLDNWVNTTIDTVDGIDTGKFIITFPSTLGMQERLDILDKLEDIVTRYNSAYDIDIQLSTDEDAQGHISEITIDMDIAYFFPIDPEANRRALLGRRVQDYRSKKNRGAEVAVSEEVQNKCDTEKGTLCEEDEEEDVSTVDEKVEEEEVAAPDLAELIKAAFVAPAEGEELSAEEEAFNKGVQAALDIVVGDTDSVVDEENVEAEFEEEFADENLEEALKYDLDPTTARIEKRIVKAFSDVLTEDEWQELIDLVEKEGKTEGEVRDILLNKLQEKGLSPLKIAGRMLKALLF